MQNKITETIMKPNEALSEALGLENTETASTPASVPQKPLISRPVASKDQIEDDATYARENIYGIRLDMSH